VAVATLGLACIGSDGLVVESDRGTIGVGSSPTLDLVGSWRHTVIVQTDGGDVQSSETAWTFEDDLDCVRVVTLRSVSFGGVLDILPRTCTYTASTASVTIVFTDDPTSVTFDARVVRDTLYLDDFAFERIR
jgi:hypothetical protein